MHHSQGGYVFQAVGGAEERNDVSDVGEGERVAVCLLLLVGVWLSLMIN